MIVNSINERISCKTVVKLRIFLPCYSTLLSKDETLLSAD